VIRQSRSKSGTKKGLGKERGQEKGRKEIKIKKDEQWGGKTTTTGRPKEWGLRFRYQ